jgi:hypothetical protein
MSPDTYVRWGRGRWGAGRAGCWRGRRWRGRRQQRRQRMGALVRRLAGLQRSCRRRRAWRGARDVVGAEACVGGLRNGGGGKTGGRASCAVLRYERGSMESGAEDEEGGKAGGEEALAGAHPIPHQINRKCAIDGPLGARPRVHTCRRRVPRGSERAPGPRPPLRAFELRPHGAQLPAPSPNRRRARGCAQTTRVPTATRARARAVRARVARAHRRV